MSGISSGIGLISGIDTASLIDQLIAIEQRPVDTLQQRLSAIDVQRAAFLEISAQLLAVQNTVTNLGRLSFFHRFSSTSSNEAALIADVSDQAVPGQHAFRVRSLVSTHAMISRGFADADSTPVGVGTLSFESARARVNRSSDLDGLNGGAGVRRGVIHITDRGGASAAIDLSTALTVEDVLNAINTNSTIHVRAYVTGLASNGATGDRIVLEDLSNGEGIAGNFIVADAQGGSMATDLGIVANTAAGRVDGHDLLYLSARTPLSLLNDGNGVGRFRSGEDIEFSTLAGGFSVSLSGLLVGRLDTDLRTLNSGQGVRLGVMRITDRSGRSAEVDVSGARTVGDVIDAINAAPTNVSATIVGVNGESRFQVSDSSEVPESFAEGDVVPQLILEDVSGATAADLGLAGTYQDRSVQGSSVFRMRTIGDVINAINFAPGNDALVEASISSDGNGIVLTALGDNNTLTVSAGTNADGAVSTAANDLGLLGAENATRFETRHLIGGLNTVLLQTLNGGRGVELGQVRMTNRAGAVTTIDFSAANTLQDVIDLINVQSDSGLRASVNAPGNGIIVHDETGGAGVVAIEDLVGGTARDLGLAGLFSGAATINGGNLNRQYVSRQTSLAELNNGRGVAQGTFTITGSDGSVGVVELGTAVTTVGDVIDAINRAASDTIMARINDRGDGIVVIDAAGGSQTLRIEDVEGGKAAADLNLAGTANMGSPQIDGSFEVHVAIDADDTLQEVSRKINQSGADVTTAVVNYGETLNPFSLTITSGHSGRAGEMLVDAIGLDLGLSTLSHAQDAIITIGGGGSAHPRVVSSSTNTIEDVVPGVTLNLLSVSDDPVTISVVQDTEGIIAAIRTFVDDYNQALDTIDDATSFDSETLSRGPLLGDAVVERIRQRLSRLPLQRFESVDPSVARLFSIGLRFASDPNVELDAPRLQFDEDHFREVYEQSPQVVEELFTTEESGLSAVFRTALEDLTRDFDGVISRKDELLTDQQALLNDRIDALNVLIDAKRARLEAQFVALESALASLQAQQTALSTLAQLAAGT